MRKEKILYIILGILFIAYVLVEFYAPKPLDWSITFSEKDKNPYGSYILYDRLNDFYRDKETTFLTLYESQEQTTHLLILSEQFRPSKTDIAALFEILQQERSVLIGASFFSEAFLDTLGVDFKFDVLKRAELDSTQINFGDITLTLPDLFVHSYFKLEDTQGWSVHANSEGPVLISKNFGNSTLILSATPLIFTNYSLLQQEYWRLAAGALKLLPDGKISYNRFYHSGKPEPRTPLRFALSQAPLRWAVYLSLFTLLTFLIIESRRKQRAIPLVVANRNTTVEYIKTIGGLYYRSGDHKNTAEKLIHRFLKVLNDKYHIQQFNERSFHIIANKSRVPVEDVIDTFNLIDAINGAGKISEEQLKELYKKIKNIQSP